MIQKYKNIFFNTTAELNTEISKILDNGWIIDSITPIYYDINHLSKQSESKHNDQEHNIDFDRSICREVFVLYHIQ